MWLLRIWFVFVLSLALKYSKKRQGIRGGLWAISFRHQWVNMNRGYLHTGSFRHIHLMVLCRWVLRSFNKRSQGDWDGNGQQPIQFTNTHIVCMYFEAVQEQRTGDVFVLFVEQVHCLHNTRTLKARPHLSIFKRKWSCFAPDTAIVQTSTPKTITKSGAIRKRSPEWSDLKKMLFKNAVF